MRKILFSIGLTAMVLAGCGGGGGSSIGGVYGSVILTTGEYEYKPRGTYCIQNNQPIFFDEVIDNLDIKSEVIKNASGQPVTQNPSPVYIDSYRVLFFSATANNNCERYPDCRALLASGYAGFSGLTVPPGGTATFKNLTLVPANWKLNTLVNYCLTPSDNCDYNAVIELHGREIYSGKTQTIRFNLRLSLYALNQCP
ncbi:MAG: hypothetical protein QXU09_03185 [Thermoproteota archaeon]